MGNFISWIQENMPSDPNTGEARSDNQPKSISGMVSTLVPVLVISGVYLVIFLIFRRSSRRFYAPRTYLGSLRETERSPELPTGFFNWLAPFWKIPDIYALQHQGLDAYLFLRFLRICAVICFVSLLLTWSVLFPVNATGGNGKSQLEILSYSNINIDTQKNRLYAHALVAWLVYGFVMYMITRECIFYINIRQAFLLTPQFANRISSRTVLLTAVPDEYLNEAKIRQLFSNDAVKHVWIAGETNDLDDMVGERDDVAMKLEKAEIKLLKAVNEERNKAGAGRPNDAPHDSENGNVAARWITDKMRPTHRLGPLGLIGRKVDTIEWGRAELHKLVPQTEAAQAEYMAGNYTKVRSVFVEFYSQSDAQAAYQIVAHHHALHMSPRLIGVKPEEVIWKNLSIPWWQAIIRRYAVYFCIAVLIIFWAIPVGIVGIIAQVNTLKSLPGLTWIGDIPPTILGVISGLLPSVALAILMSLVPVFLRAFARLAGEVTLSRVELFTQNAYFIFLLLQVFLVRTLTDAASTVIIQIAEDPGSVFMTLSSAIPTSSNFYISYFIVEGFTIASAVLTQVVGLVIFNILYKFLAGTPRAMYTKWTTLSAISWGSTLPIYTNIVVISITYSVIAPILLFWSTIGLSLFYLAYRYNILFVSDTNIDTRGLFYPRALKQLFSGIYIALVCMVGMFIVSKAAGPAVLMVVFLIFTVLYQITLMRSLSPLLASLPRSLQIEEEIIQNQGVVASDSNQVEKGTANGKRPGAGNGAAAARSGNLFSRFFKPWIHADYHKLRNLVPEHAAYEYPAEVEANAFYPPSVTAETPILWIPADPAGVSKQEIALTGKVIPISDEGSSLNEKNKIEWDTESARPPIWTEKIYY